MEYRNGYVRNIIERGHLTIYNPHTFFGAFWINVIEILECWFFGICVNKPYTICEIPHIKHHLSTQIKVLSTIKVLLLILNTQTRAHTHNNNKATGIGPTQQRRHTSTFGAQGESHSSWQTQSKTAGEKLTCHTRGSTWSVAEERQTLRTTV